MMTLTTRLRASFLILMLMAGFSAITPSAIADTFSSIGSLGDDLGLDGADEENILDPDQAFVLSTRSENGQLIAEWKIADGHYMYRDKIKIIPADDSNITTGALQLSPGEEKEDPYFGKIYVYHHQANARLPVIDNNGVQSASFKVKYQGCSEVSGICYPPITKTITFDTSLIASADAAQATAQPPISTPDISKDHAFVSEQDQIAESLQSGSVWLTLISFFGFGLLLAFTPCVFPMIPILSSIIVGQGDKVSSRSAFTMSLVYVLAMALTYTVAGVLAGVMGENIQAAFQNPWILGSFAVVFVLLSFSMFGFYDLQMPSSIQSRLTQFSNNQQGGTLTGVAIMGFLSALIVGPCVAAPLAGALIYIGQTGDAVLGGMALFALSMGMGAPLIAIGTSAGKLLPKAGTWMDAVKAVFGVMLLAVAIWMLERILPTSISILLWATLIIVSAVYMGAIDALKEGASGWYKLWKALGLMLLIYGIFLLIAVATGSGNMMQPLKGLGGGSATHSPSAAPEHLLFKKIKGVEGLRQALAEARDNNKPVMLDFYADWCTSCKEMESLTFSDPSVQAALKDVVLLQADVTPNDEKDKELYKHFGIIGPPAIIFYDSTGEEKRNYRVVGYMPAKKFSAHVKQAVK